MAIPHANPGEPFDIRPQGEAISGAVTRALIKTDKLEVIRMVVPADKAIPLHSVAGEITVQCLEGLVAFTAGGTTHELAAGQMLYLPAGVGYQADGSGWVVQGNVVGDASQIGQRTQRPADIHVLRAGLPRRAAVFGSEAFP